MISFPDHFLSIVKLMSFAWNSQFEKAIEYRIEKLNIILINCIKVYASVSFIKLLPAQNSCDLY